VRRHGKDSILAAFERRLANSPEVELTQALEEIDRIAALRLHALVTGTGALKVTGLLTTHMLDAHSGHPAAGVMVELSEVFASGGRRRIMRVITNEEGRTDVPLIAGRPIPSGHYEITFDIGAYFARQGILVAEPPFLGIVPIRFAVAEPEGHYHIPLLATPWSYTTYRGG
jgi:2-oxo-4-hydroxy-4-carboxy-5-ureidoimidazoline decarboxylase